MYINYNLSKEEQLIFLNIGRNQSNFIKNYFCNCLFMLISDLKDQRYGLCNQCNKQIIGKRDIDGSKELKLLLNKDYT